MCELCSTFRTMKTIKVWFNSAMKGEMINVEENIVVCSTHIIPSHVIVRCRVEARKRILYTSRNSSYYNWHLISKTWTRHNNCWQKKTSKMLLYPSACSSLVTGGCAVDTPADADRASTPPQTRMSSTAALWRWDYLLENRYTWQLQP